MTLDEADTNIHICMDTIESNLELPISIASVFGHEALTSLLCLLWNDSATQGLLLSIFFVWKIWFKIHNSNISNKEWKNTKNEVFFL